MINTFNKKLKDAAFVFLIGLLGSLGKSSGSGWLKVTGNCVSLQGYVEGSLGTMPESEKTDCIPDFLSEDSSPVPLEFYAVSQNYVKVRLHPT
jgi:hypothetical protein